MYDFSQLGVLYLSKTFLLSLLCSYIPSLGFGSSSHSLLVLSSSLALVTDPLVLLIYLIFACFDPEVYLLHCVRQNILLGGRTEVEGLLRTYHDICIQSSHLSRAPLANLYSPFLVSRQNSRHALLSRSSAACLRSHRSRFNLP
jgi:hypothetical protein